ncbi:Mitochondrial distribution/morphology family 35/apoptosis [Quillaja saponaria]|uniref:Mitochondrial distribution/morphology family 35/apoptosis n=1 Tax=Quillaja saponaria TaxID=32244 RepID=A0AAD7PTC3_QUISA|nr:Mitochondrial distribution/morphology family 35/apoptosis [Quillaja saponaria]
MREKKKSSSSTSPCAHLRAAYNNCFNRWYSEKFVKGQWEKEECVSDWQKYRACLSEHLEDKHLSRFLEAEGLVGSINQDKLENPADIADTGASQ